MTLLPPPEGAPGHQGGRILPPPGSSPAPALPIKADGEELRSPEKCSRGWQRPARGAWGGTGDGGAPLQRDCAEGGSGCSLMRDLMRN